MGELIERYRNKQRDYGCIQPEPPFPKILKIDVCNTCNYSCVFCPQSKQSMADKVGCIDHELCLRLIREGYEAGGREICFSSTGEPLLNKELSNYICRAKEIGYSYVFFNTNGLLLDSEMARRVLECGVDSVKFSINGGERTYSLIHGEDEYERVIKNLIDFDSTRRKLGSQCKLYVSYVTTKFSEFEVKEVVQRIQQYCDDIMILKANNRGGVSEEVDDDLYNGNDDYSYHWPCSQIFNNVYITAEGYLAACCQDFENNMIIANLRNTTLQEAWNGKKFVDFRARFLRKDYADLLCDNCLNNTHHPVVALSPEYAGCKHLEQKNERVKERIAKLKMLSDNQNVIP